MESAVLLYHWSAGAAHAAYGFAAVPQARVRAERRGHHRALEREPVLATLQWRAVLPARVAL